MPTVCFRYLFLIRILRIFIAFFWRTGTRTIWRRARSDCCCQCQWEDMWRAFDVLTHRWRTSPGTVAEAVITHHVKNCRFFNVGRLRWHLFEKSPEILKCLCCFVCHSFIRLYTMTVAPFAYDTFVLLYQTAQIKVIIEMCTNKLVCKGWRWNGGCRCRSS